MKGTLFQKPLELHMYIEGEQWHQGDVLQGKLRIKSHSSESISLENQKIYLAVGLNKKIKTREPDAFKILEERHFEELDLAAQSEKSISWAFQLPENTMVTDKTQSLYLLYGNGDLNWEGAQFQLGISPHRHIQGLLSFLETFFRFKVKTLKTNKKGLLEIKLSVPDSKDYSSVDALKLNITTSAENLKLDWEFKIKKLTYGGVGNIDGVKVEKSLMEFHQDWSPKEYQMFGGVLDQDKINQLIQKIIDQVKFKEF